MPPLTIREGNAQTAERHRRQQQQQQQSLANVDPKNAAANGSKKRARGRVPSEFKIGSRCIRIIILSLYSINILPSDFNNPIKTAMANGLPSYEIKCQMLSWKMSIGLLSSANRQKVDPIDELAPTTFLIAAGEQQQQQQHDKKENNVQF
ncbi:hypothetical protein niasHT_026806 [Heterodera trifolii]|uniref:Uncharacterized protein n=1 Tax=Heterodera trifolii TaxID=157864 RepID=A0ABD2KKY4_9BILA